MKRKGSRSRKRKILKQDRFTANIKFDKTEILLLQYMLQVFLWIGINGGFSFNEKMSDVPDEWSFGPMKLLNSPRKAFEKTMKIKDVVMKSLRDAALTSGLKTIYSNLTRKNDKLIFIAASFALLAYLKKNEINKTGILDFLKEHDILKNRTGFNKIVEKELTDAEKQQYYDSVKSQLYIDEID